MVVAKEKLPQAVFHVAAALETCEQSEKEIEDGLYRTAAEPYPVLGGNLHGGTSVESSSSASGMMGISFRVTPSIECHLFHPVISSGLQQLGDLYSRGQRWRWIFFFMVAGSIICILR